MLSEYIADLICFIILMPITAIAYKVFGFENTVIAILVTNTVTLWRIEEKKKNGEK